MEFILAIPILVIVASAVASYYRVKNYQSRFDKPFARALDYSLTFLFSFVSGLLLYQPIIDYFGLAQNLEIIVAMAASIASEGVATTFVKLANDPAAIKNALIRILRKHLV